MDNPGEMMRLCRLCLVKDQVNIPIFEEQGDIRQIFLKISSCLPVKVSRDDKLPKKICDGCSNKLDLLYEFWNTSANAEKTLLSWLGQAGVKDADETISAVAQQIQKPAETLVKQETLEDGNAAPSTESFGLQSFPYEEGSSTKDESEAPPPKRARRTAAVKAQINITPESDDEDDLDNMEPMTKVEDESEESDGEDRDPSYTDVPGTSADDQPGPSGVGKDGTEAPSLLDLENDDFDILSEVEDGECSEGDDDDPDIDRVSESDYNKIDNLLYEMRDEKNYTELKRSTDQALHCYKCGEKFENFVALHDHLLLTRTPDHCFTCSMCNHKAGFSMHKLNEHIKNCGSMEVLTEYEMRFPKVIRYYCEYCGIGFTCFSDYIQHKPAVHGGEKINCPECPQSFLKLNKLLKHFQAHTLIGNIDLFCKLCSIRFYATASYHFHMLNIHRCFKSIPYSCCLCSAIVYNDIPKFKKHVEKHGVINIAAPKGTDPNIFKSAGTGRPLLNVTSLTCEICAEMFISAEARKQHKLEEHGRKVKNSSKKKISKSEKKPHLKTQGVTTFNKKKQSSPTKNFVKKNKNLNKKSKKCEDCSQYFPTVKTLINHIKTNCSKDLPQETLNNNCWRMGQQQPNNPFQYAQQYLSSRPQTNNPFVSNQPSPNQMDLYYIPNEQQTMNHQLNQYNPYNQMFSNCPQMNQFSMLAQISQQSKATQIYPFLNPVQYNNPSIPNQLETSNTIEMNQFYQQAPISCSDQFNQQSTETVKYPQANLDQSQRQYQFNQATSKSIDSSRFTSNDQTLRKRKRDRTKRK